MAMPSKNCCRSGDGSSATVTWTIAVVARNLNFGKRCGRAAIGALLLASSFASQAVAKDPNNIATGFVVADGSWLVTSRHVVQGKPCIAVADGALETSTDGLSTLNWEAAKVLAVSARIDVAVLQIKTKRQPLSLALWSSVPVGLEALVVGFPEPGILGPAAKITDGLFSGIPEVGRAYSLFQLSAPIQFGNSGGPVLSPDGLVIGLVRARADPDAFGKNLAEAPQVVNFAVNSGALNDFLVSVGVNPRQAPIGAGPADRPFETFRRARPSVLMVAAGDWRGEEHPIIAGQKLKATLEGACSR